MKLEILKKARINKTRHSVDRDKSINIKAPEHMLIGYVTLRGRYNVAGTWGLHLNSLSNLLCQP